MSVIRDVNEVRAIYKTAGERGWVLPCICTENLTTTEAVLTAAEEYRVDHGMDTLPIILAITNQYDHRSQSVNYTKTRRWDTGLKLFTNDIKVLAEEGGPFEKLQVMIHLDHTQHDTDLELLEGDLTDYASIMYDASCLWKRISAKPRRLSRNGARIFSLKAPATRLWTLPAVCAMPSQRRNTPCGSVRRQAWIWWSAIWAPSTGPPARIFSTMGKSAGATGT